MTQLDEWKPPTLPDPAQLLRGHRVDLVPVNPDKHLQDLWQASHNATDPDLWKYLFYGPFPDRADFGEYLQQRASAEDELYYTIVDRATGRAMGICSYLRMKPAHGVIEIGHIWFGAELQRKPAATEAILLLAKHVFDELGYRRLEWKCDAANRRSRSAALRFGFAFEGVFRQHMIVKGRNRDTAWYAITDQDWPTVRRAFEMWLADDNFDGDGTQRRSLADIRSDLRSRAVSAATDAYVSVRPARAGDESRWRELWAAYNRFYEASVTDSVTAETWRRMLDNEGGFGCLVAEVNGSIVGFANYIAHPFTWGTGRRCLLEDLFVDPTARSKGVGRALIQELITIAKSKSWSKVYWMTKDDNAAARRLYDSLAPPDGYIQYSIPVKP